MKKEKWIQLRISEGDKKKIKEKAENQNKSISQFVLDSVLTNVNTPVENVLTNGLDTQILKKLLKPFAENGISVDLEDAEIKRIQELWEE
ncbi:MAG: DUF1778 domain-containing protein [Candidatus Odinarchaeota archaeon]